MPVTDRVVRRTRDAILTCVGGADPWSKVEWSMNRRICGSGWVGALLLLVGVAGTATASEPETGDSEEAYRMTLQILGGLPSCGDEWSGPEYYGAATRRDPEVEKELEGIEGELNRLEPRIEAFDERIEPLQRREHNTVPLPDGELRELETLRGRSLELARELEDTKELSHEERQALEREQDETDKAVRGLEDSIPLSEEEARFLRDQREQRAPLADRRDSLTAREGELRDLISMRTPGSLRVYPNDSLKLRLMEDDAFRDDTCATWQLTLEREILDEGGRDLESGGRKLLRLWVQPVSP